MARLVFEDPPEHQERFGVHGRDTKKNADRAVLIKRLQRYPDRWAVVSRHSSRTRAAHVARLLRARYQGLGYEFRTARRTDGQGVVYGRYSRPDVNIG